MRPVKGLSHELPPHESPPLMQPVLRLRLLLLPLHRNSLVTFLFLQLAPATATRQSVPCRFTF